MPSCTPLGKATETVGTKQWSFTGSVPTAEYADWPGCSTSGGADGSLSQATGRPAQHRAEGGSLLAGDLGVAGIPPDRAWLSRCGW